ncbi:MAG: sporulation transcriptional regulator SpoIIID [Clostridia bacterium]|nr:sporulation transcriptional regulator SpoIIID [Clostridia bacterium]MBR0510127.1 sporulation transcriptional regulator SpoIIID [Clostridia bacterium]MBR0536921.1 sporulation transcriptional regulator SpoIIID [Clostridia bacterium]
MINAGARSEKLGRYIVANSSTVRATAEVFGISKSTVHTDVNEKLREIDPALWQDVRKVLDLNKAQRHIRGGMATKKKYAEARNA